MPPDAQGALARGSFRAERKRKPPNQRVRRLLFPLFRWWLCSMATPKQHQAVLDGIKTRIQKPVPVVPIGISTSARDCLSMLCLQRGRHRIEELPHMVGGVRRMKQPVRHETAPIGRNGLGNLSGVRSMRYTFSSCAFATIDFRDFDPSTLTDLFCTGAAFERHNGLSVLLLLLHITRRRERHGLGEQQDGVLVPAYRHCGSAGVHDGGLMPGNKFDCFCRNR